MSSMNVCLHEIFYYVGIDANIATEFVSGLFFGVIIGSRNYEHGQVIKVSLQTEDFRILIKSNTAIILKYDTNTTVAVIRLELKEVVQLFG
ncbi:unnamed protein product [Rotaria sp. Silwood1]|nr:unnamed protein product [Rotaria sp. Silwood1]CAF3382597.1 unnamed protein product [Rotaria sp. Silwood1]CAF3393061.1 unnamed protein product [Rotaria sp. Silwood1]CAF3394186.1 unnamed protein product [Rotaria sp. Silwood1]CAF4734044.1 unnamed protein product [Rotaria sp. Silwood1]